MDDIIRAHAARYPLWQGQDVVKLMYQRELGCGHFAPDEQTVRDRLHQELAEISPMPGPLFEQLGGGYARLLLPQAKAANVSEALMGRVFQASARVPQAEDKQRLLEALLAVSSGDCGLSADAWTAARDAFLAGDYSPVSHSAAYRCAYAPHYRVVTETMAHFFPLLVRVEALLNTQERVTVAVDGRSGSGKSTFAACLQALYGAAVVHMDDFFLPMTRKTPERLAQPGGNVDIERFQAEVLPGLAQGQIAYRPFSCRTGTLGDRQALPQSRLIVVEGAYALHPAAAFLYDLTCFFTLSPEAQRKRILRRNGPQMLTRFEQEWIPLEEKYIRAFGIDAAADVCFDAQAGEIVQVSQA